MDKLSLILGLLTTVFSTTSAPTTSTPANNKFGLYIYSVNDYADSAAQLVNSGGGDYGYVLVPYAVYDNDFYKWDGFFRKLNENHLIPIIQLWDLRKTEDTKHAAQFLDSLPWPTTTHYVSVYNEPNDSKFWNNKIDPEGYAHVLDETINTFKTQNPVFFMLNAGFNASARSNSQYLDEEVYLLRMDKEKPGIFKKLDGWASHPYPQPNFSGSIDDTGRDSIRAYEWELDLLKNHFGVENLPVFITETGWAHQEGATVDWSLMTAVDTAPLFKEAFEKVWLPDARVVAVTPFTIKYDAPEDHFNWLDADLKPYPQYEVIKNMTKTAGRPTLSPWYTFLPNVEAMLKQGFAN